MRPRGSVDPQPSSRLVSTGVTDLSMPDRYPPLEPFEHYDHGKDADATFPELLPKGQVEVDDITPFIGSEVHGVQLSKLSKAGKDQLALYVAQRRVVG